MYRITYICIGSLKEPYWRDAENEYLKRLSPYARVSVIEHKEIPFRDSSDAVRVLSVEGNKILSSIPADAFVIVLDRGGREISSPGLSTLLEQEGGRGRLIVFVIGGPLGLDDAVRTRADFVWSFSPLTLPHQLARILLSEQVYRAMTILIGKQYHY